MIFDPSTTVHLCNVPIDNTYQNEIYFSDTSVHKKYFDTRVVKSYSDYLTVRATRPDGSSRTSIKVSDNIETLRSLGANYLMYQNAHHGMKWFYAFITQLVYISEGVTEVLFETDVYQTWLKEATLQASYVVREHSETDGIGDNVVPEKFNFQDYVYQPVYEDVWLDTHGYLVGATENILDPEDSLFGDLFGDSTGSVNGQLMSGVYQGLYFYYFLDGEISLMNKVINALREKNGECIVFITALPAFATQNCERNLENGLLSKSTKPRSAVFSISEPLVSRSFEGYAPLNNKMLTAPYYKLVVSNGNGEQAEYNFEDFLNPEKPMFEMCGDISANPSVMLIPQNYKGLTQNYDSGITISNFPQCSFNSDSFKLWLTKNQGSIALDTLGNLGQIIAGVVAIAGTGATGGASLAIGAGTIASGAQGVMGTVNSVYQASKEPNRATIGGGKTNLLTALGKNKFHFYVQTIKRDHARTIDSFFTMYGYAVNRVKVPKLNARPHFNYVQTVDCNITGSVPSDDMRTLKNIFNKGCTFWSPNATVGDYEVDNRPILEQEV